MHIFIKMEIIYSKNPGLFVAKNSYCINPTLPQNRKKLKEEYMKTEESKNHSEEEISKELEKIMINAQLGDLQ